MLYYEAEWINEKLNSIDTRSAITAVNLGSSTNDFIKSQQPYIRILVSDVLNSKFSKVVNVDIKDSPGVDLVANFLEVQGRAEISKLSPSLILVCNLLEHLPDPIAGLESLVSMTNPGTLLLITGPRRFPYHPDPIDNGFRPSLRRLKSMLEKDFEILDLQKVKSGSALTCNFPKEEISTPLKWAFNRIRVSNILQNPRLSLQVIRNALYPVSAFCVLAQKK
jgi:hypothetical protein